MRRVLLAVAAAIALALALSACGGSDTPKADTGRAQAPLRIGTKNFPEQFLLGELYKQALEAKGIPVELKANIGASEIIHQALTDGALDMYPEYVGVLLSEVANVRARPRDAEAAYRRAQAFEAGKGFRLLAPSPFSDQNALAVTPAYARSHHVQDIGDLKRVPGTVRIGAPPEFQTRFEGVIGLAQLYGLHNLKAQPMAIGSQYAALDRGRVDAAAVFTTDGQLADGRYVVLRDPRGVFGTQHVAPIISESALRRYGPRMRTVIDTVSKRLTATAMRRMNAEVQIKRRSTAEVAGAFLRGQGLT